MSEEKSLGQVAYEAYHADAITSPLLVAVQWEDQGSAIKQHWIAAAQAVAVRVMTELKTAEEASE